MLYKTLYSSNPWWSHIFYKSKTPTKLIQQINGIFWHVAYIVIPPVHFLLVDYLDHANEAKTRSYGVLSHLAGKEGMLKCIHQYVDYTEEMLNINTGSV